jgi:GAF domain-containing protein
MTTVSAQRLAAIFVEVADTLVAEFDLIEFLHMLTDRAADLVDAAAVGLLLADQRGRLEYMAGSDENVKLVELFQLQNDEGPCLEAFHTGQPVINVDLGEASSRWPRFAPRATEAGFQSVHAFPLRLRRQVIGALNVFGDTKGGDFRGMDVPIMQALADVAAIGLLQERIIRRGEVLTEQRRRGVRHDPWLRPTPQPPADRRCVRHRHRPDQRRPEPAGVNLATSFPDAKESSVRRLGADDETAQRVLRGCAPTRWCPI